MSNREVIFWIEERLKRELPGNEAHRMMLPTLADGVPINIKHDERPRQGAVLILFYEEQGHLKFPLIQRPNYAGVHSGQMALPGGKMEQADQDLTVTALRESEEEIGINRSEVMILGNLSSFFVAASNYQVLPVIGYQPSIPSFTPDQHEVEDVVIGKLHDLIDPKKRKKKEIQAATGVRLNSPYFEIENRVVWGATAMMLSELAVLLQEMNEN